MKVQSALAVAVAFAMLAGACSTNSSSGARTGGNPGNAGSAGTSGSTASAGRLGAGGSNSSGGALGAGGSAGGASAVAAGGSSGSGGAGVACSNGTPCGGDVVGTWTVLSSCLKVSGELDLSLVGTSCKSAPITGSLQVTGTWTANADGTYSDNTTTWGEEAFTLGPSCLIISSTPVSCDGAANIIKTLGYSSLQCSAVADGCSCVGTVQQTGGVGLVSVAPTKSGNYATSGSVVTLSGDAGDQQYSSCVSGNTLTWTPQSTSPTMTGTVVFQNANAPGTGGSSGMGGMSSTGGTSGTAGTSGSVGLGGAAGQAGAATGGRGGAGGMAGGAGSGSTTAPCDIYLSGSTPCVAAHSTVRALFGAYSGKLYQVRNAAGTTKDINTVTTGGVADAATQDAFCSGTTCVITFIYDQSGHGNDLEYQGSGSKAGGMDKPASAAGESVKVGGNKVYSLYINPSNSYWVDGSQKGMPTGSQPEGMYMVTSGTHYNSGCCFDYGNSELSRKYEGPGTMDALNFSAITAWGTGAGNGPWVMADLEAGIFSMGSSGQNQNVPTMTNPFVTAVLKNNGTSEFQLRGGNATSGSLTTYYKGALPGGWSPMKKQGAIILGSGGDCCETNTNLSAGTFYEGCMVAGYPSDATEAAVQANIVAAGYSK